MKMIISIIIVIFTLSNGYSQDKTVLNRHKFYDTTTVEDFQKVNRRRLTVEVDSTGVSLYAWGDECYFKINMLDRMLVNANFYETGNRNGHPYLLYGNDNLKFRMYVNKSDNFEFDAIIKNKSAKGRYQIPFNIQTKGLRFFYQDSLTLHNMTNGTSIDSVNNSYAVYHDSKRWNGTFINGPDTTYEFYGPGKAFHIYRPKVWDNSGDTIWGAIHIDELNNILWISADSTWMANAVYPVTIDPSFGRETKGATATPIVNYRHYAMWSINTGNPGAGTITSADLYAWVVSASGTNEAVVHCYEKDATVGTSDLLASSSTIDVTNVEADSAWLPLTMSGTLLSSTEYLISIQGNNSVGNNLRIAGDAVSWGQIKAWTDTDFTAPATMTSFTDNNSFAATARINYTVGGGGPEPIKNWIHSPGSIGSVSSPGGGSVISKK